MKENDDSTDDEIDDNNDDKVSISSTFYTRFFCQYFGAKIYKAETFGFETFWQKDIGKSLVYKTLMKLAAGLNFINILQAAFALIFFHRKNI